MFMQQCLLDLSFSCSCGLFLVSCSAGSGDTVFNLQLEQAAAPPVSPGPCGLHGTDTGVSVSLSQKWRR